MALSTYYLHILDGTKQQHPFNGPLSGTTQVSQYRKGKTNMDFTEARDSEWQWHQLGRMQICTLPQTDNHASTPDLISLTPTCMQHCIKNVNKYLHSISMSFTIIVINLV